MADGTTGGAGDGNQTSAGSVAGAGGQEAINAVFAASGVHPHDDTVGPQPVLYPIPCTLYPILYYLQSVPEG
jgi:hypothetical protein